MVLFIVFIVGWFVLACAVALPVARLLRSLADRQHAPASVADPVLLVPEPRTAPAGSPVPPGLSALDGA